MIAEPRPSSSAARKYVDEGESLDVPNFVARIEGESLDVQNVVGRVQVSEGFKELPSANPATGERRVLNVDSLVEVTARAIEVLGTREKAMRWLRTPVRALGDVTPLSLLNSPTGIARVQDILGQVEHGVW